MTYVCRAPGCKYTTENLDATFRHEKRKGGEHKMGLDFAEFLSNPRVKANIERMTKENNEKEAKALNQYKIDKEKYKSFLHQALKGWQYGGQGTRQLLQEFIDEVAGS